MIKTLKSELKLKPTYDELVGMIEDADKENRPPIDKIIDRRATLFRNNQFGSQLDNIDFLGLKKQEEDRAKEDVRQAQLRQTGIMARTSTGTSSIRTSGFTTPAEVYEMDDASSEVSRDIRDGDDMTSEEATRIRAEIERYLQRQQQAQQTSSSTARSDLDVAHRQSLPVGMNIEEEEELPPLETPTEIAEEDEEDDEDEELIPDDEMKTPSRKHKTTIDYDENINKWRSRNVSADDIMFQLYLRGITLEKKQEDELNRLKTKGKGKTLTKKDYLLNFIEKLMMTGQWTNEVNDQLLKSRTEEWKQMKGKGKGSGSASSSSGIGGAIASGARAVGGAIIDAGKEAVKDAVIVGAKNAVMSLI